MAAIFTLRSERGELHSIALRDGERAGISRAEAQRELYSIALIRAAERAEGIAFHRAKGWGREIKRVRVRFFLV